MAKSQYFAYVENGEILRNNVQRGSLFNGKRLGKESDDSKYAEFNLFPLSGTMPAYDASTQTCTGPAYSWNESLRQVDRAWTVTDKPISDFQASGKKQIDSTRYTRSTGNIPFTCSAGTFNFCKGTEEIAELKQAVNDINSGSVTFAEVTGGYWRSNDNVNVAMSELEFKDLSRTITLYVAGLGRESHIQKSAIQSATTKADIDAIVAAYKTYNPLA